MCIHCSGIHRRLGVQVSKVRSIRLDTRAWEASVLAVFFTVGNTASNSIWEARLNERQSRSAIDGAAAMADWAFHEDTASEDEEHIRHEPSGITESLLERPASQTIITPTAVHGAGSGARP